MLCIVLRRKLETGLKAVWRGKRDSDALRHMVVETPNLRIVRIVSQQARVLGSRKTEKRYSGSKLPIICVGKVLPDQYGRGRDARTIKRGTG